MTKDYDIIIVGGGIVGLACGLALAKLNSQIAIVESKPAELDFDDTQYDPRVISVNPETIDFFKELGVWHAIRDQRVSAFDKITVWSGQAILNFSAADINEPESGFIIENRVIRKSLWEKVQQTKNITLITNTELVDVVIDNAAQLSTTDGTLTTKLVIGADGANSWLRQQRNPPMKSHDYHHHALVATIETEASHNKTAWQHFLSTGPLAFLPLANPNQCSIVWSSSPSHIDSLKQLDDEAFIEQLNQAFEHRLGNMKALSPRFSFPLQMQHLKDYVQPHIAFIGDAAHRIHPLAGQGANLGFMDAKCLAKTLQSACESNKDCYSLSNLQKYQRERKYYNSQMLIAMDALKALFTTKSPTLSSLRNMGIDTIEKTPLIKNLFCKRAMGK